jgi:pseudaminic acid biosynthesis-associated methylase
MSNLELWKGKFGNEYHQRNIIVKPDIEARTKMWRYILNKTHFCESILEIGAGQGINLIAINNDAARNSLQYLNLPLRSISDSSITELPFGNNSMELVFTSGVLIHVPREHLIKAFDEMYRVSSKYIVMIEYFSPTPRHISYHGKDNVLWTDDYGSLFWSRHECNVELVDYGFEWKCVTGLDNLTWWIYRKVGP